MSFYSQIHDVLILLAWIIYIYIYIYIYTYIYTIHVNRINTLWIWEYSFYREWVFGISSVTYGSSTMATLARYEPRGNSPKECTWMQFQNVYINNYGVHQSLRKKPSIKYILGPEPLSSNVQLCDHTSCGHVIFAWIYQNHAPYS